MSALKSCEHCGGTNIWRWIDDGEHIQCVTCGCGFHYSGSTADIEEAWNTRHDPNPWRYPSLGELPSRTARWYLVTFDTTNITLKGEVGKAFFSGRKQWVDILGYVVKIRAWRELEPAPEEE